MSAHLQHLSTCSLQWWIWHIRNVLLTGKFILEWKLKQKKEKPKKDESVIYILGFVIVVLSLRQDICHLFRKRETQALVSLGALIGLGRCWSRAHFTTQWGLQTQSRCRSEPGPGRVAAACAKRQSSNSWGLRPFCVRCLQTQRLIDNKPQSFQGSSFDPLAFWPRFKFTFITW